jgi:hypothetical protein
MGDNKKTRIKLEGWLEHIAIHERKIAKELAKPEPNMGLVVHLGVGDKSRHENGCSIAEAPSRRQEMTIVHSLEQIRASNITLLEELGEHAEAYLQILREWKANPTVELRAKLEVAASILKSHAEILESSLELEDELSDEE